MIRLTNIQYLKDNYIFDDNIDDKYILANIDKCQAFIIKPSIGEIFYNELLIQIDEDTLTTQNRTIIEEYIEPIIAYDVLSESVYATCYKMKNEGLVEGQQYRFSELTNLSKKYKADCDVYQSIMTKYLCENGINRVIEKNTTTNNPIYFPCRRNQYNYLEQPEKK
jgi:hypothetical protein